MKANSLYSTKVNRYNKDNMTKINDKKRYKVQITEIDPQDILNLKI